MFVWVVLITTSPYIRKTHSSFTMLPPALDSADIPQGLDLVYIAKRPSQYSRPKPESGADHAQVIPFSGQFSKSIKHIQLILVRIPESTQRGGRGGGFSNVLTKHNMHASCTITAATARLTRYPHGVELYRQNAFRYSRPKPESGGEDTP